MKERLSVLNVRVEHDTIRRLKREAKLRKLSFSSWVRAILGVPWPPSPLPGGAGPSSQAGGARRRPGGTARP